MLFLVLSGLFVIGCFVFMITMTVVVNNRRKKKTRQLIEYYEARGFKKDKRASNS